MPADREYLIKFYQKSHDSPKGDISSSEFIAKVEHFHNEFPFAKTFVKITNPNDLTPSAEDVARFNEEKAKPGNTLPGWDNLAGEMIKNIGEELERHNPPQRDKEQVVTGLITDCLDALGRLLGAEIGRGEKKRRISDKELENIGSRLWEARVAFLGGIGLPNATYKIMSELIGRGIQEYTEWSEAPPNWKDGWLWLPQPDDGFAYDPPYRDFRRFGDDEENGPRRVDWVPFHKEGNMKWTGKKYSPHFGNFNAYKAAEILQKINFSHNTMLQFGADIKCNVIQFEPEVKRYVKYGRIVPVELSTHEIGVQYYIKTAAEALGEKGTGTFKAKCERTKPSRADLRKRRIRKFEYGIKTPLLVPSGWIFKTQGGYRNYALCFAHHMAWMVELGILKMGEYVQEADYTSTQPNPASHVQLAIKNMGTYLLARLKWLDPTFLASPLGARLFLLCGFKVTAIGKIKLPRWERPKTFSKKNIFLSFEVPTPCAIEVPLLGRNMPLHDDQFHQLWQEGGVKGVEIEAQLLTFYQQKPHLSVVCAANPSYMPKVTVLFDSPTEIPKVINLGKF